MAQAGEATYGELGFELPDWGAGSRAEAFRRAQRHSRRVRWLKVMLPGLAVLMTGGLIAYSVLIIPDHATIAPAGPSPAEGKLVMDAPRLEGFTGDGRAYSVDAARATQDYDQQDIVDLEGIDAKMPIENGNWARVETSNGTYDRIANTLDVPTDIVVTTTDGLVARLKSAFLDINNGTLKTTSPIDIQSYGSRITADSMQVLDNGKRAVFENRVKVHIDLGRLKEAQAARGETNASN